MKLLVVLCSIMGVALAFSSGAPEKACGDMFPQHGAPVQNSPFPYVISLSSTSIKPNGKVKVTLSSKPGDSFKGFFIQGRVGNEAVGKFEIVDAYSNVKFISCGKGVNTGATHNNSQVKEKIAVEWQAPPSLTDENVVFFVTVARNGGTYWVAQKSSPLAVRN